MKKQDLIDSFEMNLMDNPDQMKSFSCESCRLNNLSIKV